MREKCKKVTGKHLSLLFKNFKVKFRSGLDVWYFVGALVYFKNVCVALMVSKYTRWVCDGDVCEKGGWPFQHGLSLVGHACMSAEIRCEETPEFAVPVKFRLTERSSVNSPLNRISVCLIVWVCLCARTDVCQPDVRFWPRRSRGRKSSGRVGCEATQSAETFHSLFLGLVRPSQMPHSLNNSEEQDMK